MSLGCMVSAFYFVRGLMSTSFPCTRGSNWAGGAVVVGENDMPNMVISAYLYMKSSVLHLRKIK